MKKPLGAGMIGCGGFARGVHIPNLMKNPKYKIIGAADINEDAARAVKDETGADYFTLVAEEMLDDERIDVVFITTRHDSHARLSLKAADKGKHMLCEKPMGLNIEECRQVAEAVKKSGVKYTVGYNRGLAPMAAKAKELFTGRKAKIMAFHRMQNTLPPDHWLLDPAVGGGRITGEGCHIFDMLCEIIQSPPVKVYASGGRFLEDGIDPRDSAEIVITFADGSAATALLMSAGCDFFPKESTEIYSGGRAVHINDFREMEYCGFAGQNSVKVSFDKQDKGHAVEIDLLADAVLNDTLAPNEPEKAARAALIGFKAAESIETGESVDISEQEYKL